MPHIIIFVMIILSVPAFSSCQRVSSKFIGIQSIGAEDLNKAVDSKAAPIIIDIRDEKSYLEGHIRGAIHLNPDRMDSYAANSKIERQGRIVAVCAHGWDSQIAAATLMTYGYGNVYNLVGGIRRWMI